MSRLSPLLIVGVSLSVLVVACASIVPSAEFSDLKTRVMAADADDIRYETARVHLAAAEEALEEKDEKSLNRFVTLGLLTLRIAEAQVLQADLTDGTEQQLQQKQQLESELVVLRHKVDLLLEKNARAEMRTHLEQVVAANTREAAAAEELQSQIEDVSTDTLLAAQVLVGRELIAMAKIRVALAQLMVVNEKTLPERLHALSGAAALMEESLGSNDLASVYRYGEKNLAEYVRLMDDVWRFSQKDGKGALTALKNALENEKMDIVADDPGWTATVPLQFSQKPGVMHSSLEPSLESIVGVLRQLPGTAVQIVLSSGGKSAAGRKELKLWVEKIQTKLQESDIPASLWSIQFFLGERPLRAMTGTGVRGALVFLPLP
ncbi:MAG: hypothetical protein JXR76_27395 [Deltaproteobacteria bacterium]|nr:hypothetical protein [Deltaproteobacteria bacterium]